MKLLQPQSDTQRRYWEAQTRRRDPTDPVVEMFAAPKVRFVARHVDLPVGSRILDVGCGNGYFTHYLAGLAPTVGVDLARAMLSLNPSPRLVQGSALELPFSAASFELTFCSNLLHHLPSPEAAVAEMARVSRRWVVLSEPNRYNPLMFALGLVKKEERQTLRFTKGYLQRIAESAGLRVVACETLGWVTPNRLPRAIATRVGRFNRPHPMAAYAVLVAERG